MSDETCQRYSIHWWHSTLDLYRTGLLLLSTRPTAGKPFRLAEPFMATFRDTGMLGLYSAVSLWNYNTDLRRVSFACTCRTAHVLRE